MYGFTEDSEAVTLPRAFLMEFDWWGKTINSFVFMLNSVMF